MPYRASPPPQRPCPRCAVPLTSRQIGDASVAECSGCGGVFVAGGVLDGLIGDEQREAARAAYAPGATSTLSAGGPMYVKCPVCSTLMLRRQFALGAKVVVDVCQPHGTWFDRHELGNVLTFVDGGGLERARKEQEERAAAEERLARTPRRVPFEPPSSQAGWERASGRWGLLVGLFRSLRR